MYKVIYPIIPDVNHCSLPILFRVSICQSIDLCIDLLLWCVGIVIKAIVVVYVAKSARQVIQFME